MSQNHRKYEVNAHFSFVESCSHMMKRHKILPPAKHPRRLKLVRIWHKRLREPILTLLLALQIFILFVMPSVRAAGYTIPHIAIWLIFLAFVALATLLSRSKVAEVTLLISVCLTLAGAFWRFENTDLASDAVSTAGQVLTQLSLFWVLSTAVFGPGPTSPHRILGAVVMYLTIGMIFTSLDIFLAQSVPNAFTHLPGGSFELRETLTYFSFSTLTTGNFGDIIPVHPIARSLANLESICGQLFPATLLARIVGMHSSRKDKEV